jgi:hypothetical protein
LRKNCGYKNKRDINNPDQKKIDRQIMFEYAYDRPAKKDKADSEKKNPYVSSHNFAVLQQIPPFQSWAGRHNYPFILAHDNTFLRMPLNTSASI